MRALVSAFYMLTINLIGAALGPTAIAFVPISGSPTRSAFPKRFRSFRALLRLCRFSHYGSACGAIVPRPGCVRRRS